MSYYMQGLLANLGINILGALSVYIIVKSGQISVGNAGFMAIGAYLAAASSIYLKTGIWLSVFCGGLAAAVAGFFVGFPALRLRGTYLVIGTIGFGEMMKSVFLIAPYFGGANGLRGIPRTEIWLIFLFGAAAALALKLLERTRVGLSMSAVCSDDIAAGSMGVNVVGIKLLAFVLGAFLAGLSGGFYSHWVQYIEPEDFTIMVSTMMLLPVILGGKERLAGPLLGAAIFTFLPEVLRFAETLRMVVYGVLVIAVVILRPRGLLTKGRSLKKAPGRRGAALETGGGSDA